MSQAQVVNNGLDKGLDKLLAAGRSLWLAGLGAVAEVEEGGRELFGRLVERGRPLEAKQRQAAEAVAGRAQKTARELRKLLQDTVAYESRAMLKRLNLMTREDVKTLSTRVGTLSKQIDEYATRREAASVATLEIPVAEIPLTASGAPKPAQPRPRKTTKR
jgi:poly(hydroxyalkanoate) granule-associated protein